MAPDRKRRPLRIATGILIAATLAVASCGRQGASSAGAAATSSLPLLTIEAIPTAREQSFDGVLEAVNQATVSAQASGRIVELLVDVDSTVRKGDVIARLKDTEPRARLDAAQASLREAQAHATQAQAEYLRVRDIVEHKLMTQSQMDSATAARDAADARLAQARAALADAREQQDYALVRAPYAGIVTARSVQVGELASPGRPLVTMLSLDRLRAVVDVPQQFIGDLRSSGKARVTFPDGGSEDAGAVHIFPYADEHTHTFRVRVDLPESGTHAVFPGELVKISFAGPAAPLIGVPWSALAWRGEVSGVYVQDQQQLQFRAVRPGRRLADGRIEILSGLAAGERIALDPVAAARALRVQDDQTS